MEGRKGGGEPSTSLDVVLAEERRKKKKTTKKRKEKEPHPGNRSCPRQGKETYFYRPANAAEKYKCPMDRLCEKRKKDGKKKGDPHCEKKKGWSFVHGTQARRKDKLRKNWAESRAQRENRYISVDRRKKRRAKQRASGFKKTAKRAEYAEAQGGGAAICVCRGRGIENGEKGGFQ